MAMGLTIPSERQATKNNADNVAGHQYSWPNRGQPYPLSRVEYTCGEREADYIVKHPDILVTLPLLGRWVEFIFDHLCLGTGIIQ